MDLFMPAERVLYDRAYYLSDEAEKDFAFEVAEEHGADMSEVLHSDELMDEVHDALERRIDIDFDEEVNNFDSMLRELKRGDDPEHPAEISVVAKGSVGRWDSPFRGLVAASFREDIFNSQQNSLVGLTVLATLPLDAFLDASLSMICRGDREKAGTFTVKPGTYEPIMGIYDPINGCGGTAGIELDTDFDIDPRDIKYTMMEPRGGKWESDRIDLYTPQDCFGFSEPFAGRIEYSEKKPKIAAKAKPDPADLGRRASVAAGATIRDGVDGGGIKL